jgi:hypothetical protein
VLRGSSKCHPCVSNSQSVWCCWNQHDDEVKPNIGVGNLDSSVGFGFD